MEMERTANIAFMVLLLIPVALFFGFQNLLLLREINLSRRHRKKEMASEVRQPGKAGSVRALHSGKRRLQDRKKALFR
jgi:hypothetical protein